MEEHRTRWGTMHIATLGTTTTNIFPFSHKWVK